MTLFFSLKENNKFLNLILLNSKHLLLTFYIKMSIHLNFQSKLRTQKFELVLQKFFDILKFKLIYDSLKIFS